jgi:hypothetical protein
MNIDSFAQEASEGRVAENHRGPLYTAEDVLATPLVLPRPYLRAKARAECSWASPRVRMCLPAWYSSLL